MVKLPSFVGMLAEGDSSLASNAKDFIRGTSMEEVATVELNYAEICALMDSGTVEHDSPLYKKLKVARDAFLRQPKVYGHGYGIKVRKNK